MANGDFACANRLEPVSELEAPPPDFSVVGAAGKFQILSVREYTYDMTLAVFRDIQAWMADRELKSCLPVFLISMAKFWLIRHASKRVWKSFNYREKGSCLPATLRLCSVHLLGTLKNCSRRQLMLNWMSSMYSTTLQWMPALQMVLELLALIMTANKSASFVDVCLTIVQRALLTPSAYRFMLELDNLQQNPSNSAYKMVAIVQKVRLNALRVFADIRDRFLARNMARNDTSVFNLDGTKTNAGLYQGSFFQVWLQDVVSWLPKSRFSADIVWKFQAIFALHEACQERFGFELSDRDSTFMQSWPKSEKLAKTLMEEARCNFILF